MITTNQKTTIYLNPYVKRFIQHKAVNEGLSLSAVINEHFADLLEDLEDANELQKLKQDASFVPWLEVKAQLKKDGLL